MFRVYQRKGSAFYWADISVPDPEGGAQPLRLRATTKKRTKRAALAAAAVMEKAAMRRAGADDETADAVLAAVEEAARLRAQGKLTVEAGRTLIARMVEAHTGEAMGFATVRSWFTAWAEGRRAVLSESSADHCRGHVGLLLGWLGPDADQRLEWLTRERLTQFRDALTAGFRPPFPNGKPRQPSPRRARTVNIILVTVSAGLRQAVRDKLLLANPADGLERPKTTDSEVRQPFTHGEVDAMLAAAPSAEWRALIAAGYFAGLRLMDAAGLRWRNVDLLGRVIRLTPQKTAASGRELTVPMHPRLQALLEALPSADDEDALVLPKLGRLPRWRLCEAFPPIMAKAGVDPMPSKNKVAARKTNKRTFHSLRHSLATALAASDVPAEVRMAILGHSSASVHAGYTHQQLQTLRRALEKL